MAIFTLCLLWRRQLFIGGLLLLSSYAFLFGQRLNSLTPKYYSVNNGLSDRLVTDIIQSKDGFIWLGTTNGLNKFDGYDFIVFNDNKKNPNYISDINIGKLALCKDGKILIVYRNKLSFFDLLDPNTHQTTKVDLLLPESGIKGIVRQVTTNRHGEIIVLSTSQDGTFLYRYQGKNHFHLILKVQEKRDIQSVVASILQLKNGNYLLNDSEKGIRLLKPNGSLIKSFNKDSFSYALSPEAYPGVPSIFHEDRKGRIWISYSKNPGVFLFSEHDNSFNLYNKLPPHYNYSYVWEDQQGNLLFVQTNGTGTYPEAQHIYCLWANDSFSDYSHLVSLSPRIISIYSEDFHKTILVGIDTGLKIIQNSFYNIQTYLANSLSDDQRGEIIRGLVGNDQNVYFAEESGKWYTIDLKSNQLDTIPFIDRQTGQPLTDINCTLDLYLDNQNILWGIACNSLQEGQLIRHDLTTGITDVFRYEDRLRAISAGRNGKFWLLAEAKNESGSLVSFDPTTRQFTTYLENGQINPLKGATPYYIIEDRKGLIWVGTNLGLIAFNAQKGTSKIYQTQTGYNGNGLRSNTIYVIHEDKKGLIWIGTANGLSVLDPKTDLITTYDQRNGLASNTVCGILPDEKENLWISTFNGLSHLDRENNEFHNFFAIDGLSHDEFNRFSFYRDVKGRYYFGTVNGLNVFHAGDLLSGEKIPSVVITKIVRYNSRKDTTITQYDRLNPLGSIVVTPGDNYFQVHFMLPKFSDPDRNQFSTWLEGYEKDWTYQGNTSFIRYNSLPPGTYTLHIKGADPNGNRRAEPLSIKIFVKRSFYQTIWFWLIIVGILSGVAYAAFRYQWEQKLQVERFRTKLSSDLHDELSGLLSGIAMQTDMLQMMTEDETTKSRLRHIGEVSRKAMSKMSDVIWSIDSRKDKMGDLLLRMREHADDILLPLNIKYAFEAKKIDPQHRIPPTTRQELYLIFKESINNIAKHSNANLVNVNLQNSDGFFIMEIQDNGKGIPKGHNGNGSHSGQGLSNIKMRARRISAKVEIIKNQGYTVKLKMRRFA